jgi:hypothetical protein
MWRVGSQKILEFVNDDTSHRGPEASKNVHGGPQLRKERFSIVFGLDLRRQMGATKYIDTDNGNLDPYTIFEMSTGVKSSMPRIRIVAESLDFRWTLLFFW